MSPLAQKTEPLRILVHGATGGIGSALVQKLVSEYPAAKVIATGRRDDALGALKESCGVHESRLKTYRLDSLNEEQLAQLTQFIKDDCDGLDVCIHTIGALKGEGFKPEKSLRDVNLTSLVESFSINTASFLLLAKHLHRLFRHEKPSVFAAISAKVGSIADNQLGGWYSYRLSKTALNMSICTVALEYGTTGCKTITVALHPGTTETALTNGFLAGYPAHQIAQPPETAERLLAVLRKVNTSDSGRFLNWDGQPLPW
jgi:NAD(P)-dependent dehydrogenase (short-subunit alcohol dehydrogenase family)